MNIVVNGKDMDLKNDKITVLELIETLQIADKVMAAAINMEVVKKEDWKTREIKQNDKVEFLQFVGGG